MAFEQLMAEAQMKKKEDKKQRREKHKSSSKDNLASPPHREYEYHGTGEKYNPNA